MPSCLNRLISKVTRETTPKDQPSRSSPNQRYGHLSVARATDASEPQNTKNKSTINRSINSISVDGGGDGGGGDERTQYIGASFHFTSYSHLWQTATSLLWEQDLAIYVHSFSAF